jgi:hypothetical protein
MMWFSRLEGLISLYSGENFIKFFLVSPRSFTPTMSRQNNPSNLKLETWYA